MDSTIGSGEDSFDMLDWNPQAESPSPEKAVCLCSRMSKDMGEHDPVMCEWYSAMDGSARLTGIPSGLEESFNSVGEPDAMMTEPGVSADEQYSFGVLKAPIRDFVPGWVVHNHSDLEVAPPFDGKPMLRLEDLWDRPEPYDLQRDLDIFEAIMKEVSPVTSESKNVLNDVPGLSTPLTETNTLGDDDQQAALQMCTDLGDTTDSRNLAQQTGPEHTVNDAQGLMTPLIDGPRMHENYGQEAAPQVHTVMDDTTDSRDPTQQTDPENTLNDKPRPMTPLMERPDMIENDGQRAAPEVHTELDDATHGQIPAPLRGSDTMANDVPVLTSLMTRGPDMQENQDQQATAPMDMCPDDTNCGQVSAKRRNPDARRHKKRSEHKQRMDRIVAELNRRAQSGEGRHGDLPNNDGPQQSLPPTENSAASMQDSVDDFLDELSPDWVG